MSTTTRFRMLAVSVFLFAMLSYAQTASNPALTVDLSKPLHAVSPTLYGLMTEEINFSYDGGLYAEMVRNRAFQDSDHRAPARWYLVEKGDASASIRLDPTTGPSEALHSSLRIDVKKASQDNQAGVLNEGYWGIALRPNTTYQGSFYAKADSDAMGPVTISLINNKTGQAVATVTVASLSGEWKKYDYSLHTGEIEPSSTNHLSLTFGHIGTAWFSLVSLFPPTYHNRANGNRPDLMEKLAAMDPKFLRLPGGNYLEGDEIWERYEFKTTIGPLVDRPTHPSPWRYRSSDGMGLLEFLEWCEDLKIQPVLAVYAGYSMKQQFINPGPNLDPYVQDALDELQYVTGDVNSKWGAERAKDGHPEPFKLTYVEVGNEDFFDKSGSYEGRYAQFYRAIKAKYPQLEIIATTPVKSIKPDVIDDHFYRRASEMFADTSHYDKADRGGPKIFVGEWATREGSPTLNLGAALGDAAWMTGLERNSDLVVMAAYAPLFVNVNPGGMQWESDLIGYNAMTSYGSPSYYAQVMFGNALGSEVPASNLSNSSNQRFFYSVTNDPNNGRVYLKLVNGSSNPQPVDIKIDGARHVNDEASLITLSAPNPTDTNSIDDPKRIVPVESSLNNIGATFNHTVPAYAIQVIELSTK